MRILAGGFAAKEGSRLAHMSVPGGCARQEIQKLVI